MLTLVQMEVEDMLKSAVSAIAMRVAARIYLSMNRIEFDYK